MKSAHNLKIKKLANKYQKMGCRVRAHIPGFRQPRKIGGKIPDLDISCHGNRIIIEVETPSSLLRDRRQRRIFKNFAARNKKTSFRMVLVKR